MEETELTVYYKKLPMLFGRFIVEIDGKEVGVGKFSSDFVYTDRVLPGPHRIRVAIVIVGKATLFSFDSVFMAHGPRTKVTLVYERLIGNFVKDPVVTYD